MPSRPTTTPDWAESTVNLPSTGASNKIAPPPAHLTVGMDYNEPLTAEELNYQLNLFSRWIKYLDTPVNKPNVVLYSFPGASTTVQGYTSITLSLTAGVTGDTYTFPLGTITKSANQANGTATTGTQWVAGASQPGWLAGTVIASSTWYNVFALVRSNGTLDMCFASLSTTPAAVLTALGSAITKAVWVGIFYRLNASYSGTPGLAFSTIQTTHATHVFPFYQVNGVQAPIPFNIPLYDNNIADWTSLQEVNTILNLPAPTTSVTNGVNVVVEFSIALTMSVLYDATAGLTARNIIGVIATNQTTSSTATDSFDWSSIEGPESEYMVWGVVLSTDATLNINSTTCRVINNTPLRIVARYGTAGRGIVSFGSWRILDFDQTVRNFLV